MAAIAFDPMECIQQLEASGIPRDQAEAVVKVYTGMFVHNFDALVTKDYLDARFSEFESRVGLRFAETDGKLKDLESRIDLRFAESESRTNMRFAELESKIDVRFARMNVIQGVILVALVIPVLQAVLTWVR
jgi:hypothetical protein